MIKRLYYSTKGDSFHVKLQDAMQADINGNTDDIDINQDELFAKFNNVRLDYLSRLASIQDEFRPKFLEIVELLNSMTDK